MLDYINSVPHLLKLLNFLNLEQVLLKLLKLFTNQIKRKVRTIKIKTNRTRHFLRTVMIFQRVPKLT